MTVYGAAQAIVDQRADPGHCKQENGNGDKDLQDSEPRTLLLLAAIHREYLSLDVTLLLKGRY